MLAAARRSCQRRPGPARPARMPQRASRLAARQAAGARQRRKSWCGTWDSVLPTSIDVSNSLVSISTWASRPKATRGGVHDSHRRHFDSAALRSSRPGRSGTVHATRCSGAAAAGDLGPPGQGLGLFDTNGLFIKNSACCGTVVCNRCGECVSGLAKSKVRNSPGRFCRSMKP